MKEVEEVLELECIVNVFYRIRGFYTIINTQLA